MSEAINDESSLQEDKSTNLKLKAEVKVDLEELGVEYKAARDLKVAIYHFHMEKINNIVLQIGINSVTDEITALKDSLDRKDFELISYRRLVTIGKKVLFNLRKDLIDIRRRNNELSLRNEYLEGLVGHLKEKKKRTIHSSRRIERKSAKDSKLAEVWNIENEKETTSVEKKYQDMIEKLEDSFNHILEENHRMNKEISRRLESLNNRKLPCRWKSVKKLAKPCSNIFGSIKELVLKVLKKKTILPEY